ncbi:MAG TPA: pyridoxine 5'-phosphate oxidase C-terminal domain-containing protein, partial [Phnomibacter sp.]|nr:pyridoxine 5'-phosphate oxidase C-terminal domain-containing protein [Phnomibacter sp.]
KKISEQESEYYFPSPPAGSQLGAGASPQSQVVPNRQWLQQNYEDYAARFKEQPIPKPPHWGGWRVVPQTVEFWQGRPSRLHDRVLYTLQPGGTWSITRLAP